MNFRPLHDRVLIERLEQETKTAAGIIIPESAKEKPIQGKVIAVGTGTKSESGTIQLLDVKVGDTVLFGKWAGNEVKIDNNEYVIMKESEILGILS